MSYHERAKQHRLLFQKELERLSSHLDWDRKTLEYFQLIQLKKLLVHATERSLFYRDHLADVNIQKIESIRDLQCIKPITKSMVMQHWDDIVCTPCLTLQEAKQHIAALNEDAYLKETFHVLPTSASSGKPGIFAYGWEEWPTYLAASQRWINLVLKEKNLDSNEIVSVQIGPHIASHMTAAMFDTFSSGRPKRHRISVFENAHSIVKQLNQFLPDVLLCYPSIMRRLLQTDLQKQLHINPEIIVLNSETLSLPLRQRVKAQWPDAIVLNLMGSTEGGAMAINCIQQKRLHVNEDLVVIEQHKTGTYLTNLFNYTFPLIRYEMQDQIQFSSQPCACGSSYQLIEEPQGREADIFIYNDQTHILYVVIGGVLDRLASLSGYHVWQTKNGIELGLLEKECTDVNTIISALEQSLADAGLHQPFVTVKFLSELNRGRTGKLINFIPLKSEAL